MQWSNSFLNPHEPTETSGSKFHKSVVLFVSLKILHNHCFGAYQGHFFLLVGNHGHMLQVWRLLTAEDFYFFFNLCYGKNYFSFNIENSCSQSTVQPSRDFSSNPQSKILFLLQRNPQIIRHARKTPEPEETIENTKFILRIPKRYSATYCRLLRDIFLVIHGCA